MKALLEAGASVKIFAMDDMSAMHFAAQKGHAEVVNVLLNHGTSSRSCPEQVFHVISTGHPCHQGDADAVLEQGPAHDNGTLPPSF